MLIEKYWNMKNIEKSINLYIYNKNFPEIFYENKYDFFQ